MRARAHGPRCGPGARRKAHSTGAGGPGRDGLSSRTEPRRHLRPDRAVGQGQGPSEAGSGPGAGEWGWSPKAVSGVGSGTCAQAGDGGTGRGCGGGQGV